MAQDIRASILAKELDNVSNNGAVGVLRNGAPFLKVATHSNSVSGTYVPLAKELIEFVRDTAAELGTSLDDLVKWDIIPSDPKKNVNEDFPQVTLANESLTDEQKSEYRAYLRIAIKTAQKTAAAVVGANSSSRSSASATAAGSEGTEGDGTDGTAPAPKSSKSKQPADTDPRVNQVSKILGFKSSTPLIEYIIKRYPEFGIQEAGINSRHSKTFPKERLLEVITSVIAEPSLKFSEEKRKLPVETLAEEIRQVMLQQNANSQGIGRTPQAAPPVTPVAYANSGQAGVTPASPKAQSPKLGTTATATSSKPPAVPASKITSATTISTSPINSPVRVATGTAASPTTASPSAAAPVKIPALRPAAGTTGTRTPPPPPAVGITKTPPPIGVAGSAGSAGSSPKGPPSIPHIPFPNASKTPGAVVAPAKIGAATAGGIAGGFITGAKTPPPPPSVPIAGGKAAPKIPLVPSPVGATAGAETAGAAGVFAGAKTPPPAAVLSAGSGKAPPRIPMVVPRPAAGNSITGDMVSIPKPRAVDVSVSGTGTTAAGSKISLGTSIISGPAPVPPPAIKPPPVNRPPAIGGSIVAGARKGAVVKNSLGGAVAGVGVVAGTLAGGVDVEVPPPPTIHGPTVAGKGGKGQPPQLGRRIGKTPPSAPTAAQEAITDAVGGDAKAAPAEKLQPLVVRPPIVVRDFAIALKIRPFKLVSELMEMGIFASMTNSIDEPIAIRIAKKHGIALEIRHRGEAGKQVQKVVVKKTDHDDPKFLKPRPPVVCVLGHVDHGKTTLLDYFRKSNVVSGEAGGITQHVGAYTVEHKDNHGVTQRITFLDTPGHAAFSKMRERGAEITDIAILVVAADDGFMPQTDEALKFAQKNNVQIVVAINKTDARGANVDRIKQQMQQRGIASEDWGGTILTTPVSALKGDGMDDLLESVLLQAEVMELKANPERPAEGTVVEAQMETGRGPTATVIVQRGTLKPGAALVCGQHFCKVRAMFDDRGRKLTSVPPGNPALVLGWSSVPTPGAVFQVCENERKARELAEENELNLRKALEEENDLARAEKLNDFNRLSDMDRLKAALAQNKEKVLKVVCKADVNGTLEALASSLESIKSDKVKLEIVAQSVGPITQNDVNVAHAAGAVIVAFDVKTENGVPALLKSKGVRVLAHNIIYMLLDNVREAMTELLDPVLRENRVGLAEIRQIFPFGKNGQAAGCMVIEGNIRRDFKARLLRPEGGRSQSFFTVHEGSIDTLRRFKEDVTEVKSGYECGIRLANFDEYATGDQIECYEILQEKPTL